MGGDSTPKATVTSGLLTEWLTGFTSATSWTSDPIEKTLKSRSIEGYVLDTACDPRPLAVPRQCNTPFGANLPGPELPLWRQEVCHPVSSLVSHQSPGLSKAFS